MFSKKPKEFSDIPFPRWGLMAADGRLVLKGDSPSTSVEVVSKFAVRERCSFVTLSYEDAGVFINKHSLGGKTFSCNEGRVMPVAQFRRLSARGNYGWNELGVWEETSSDDEHNECYV